MCVYISHNNDIIVIIIYMGQDSVNLLKRVIETDWAWPRQRVWAQRFWWWSLVFCSFF